MPQTVYFDNRQIVLPGAYSTVTTSETSPARVLDWGKVIILDTGVYGATWGGGAGVNGKYSQGKDAVYTFDTLADFKSFVKGGMYWKIAEGLFQPDPNNRAAVGVSQLLFVRAATTNPASMTFATTSGGTFKVNTIDEGLCANGVMATDNLSKGYGYSIVASEEDDTQWIMRFYLGTFTGLAEDGYPIGEILAESANPLLVLQSPEFADMKELIAWAKSSAQFTQLFKLDPSSAVVGDGVIAEADVSTAMGDKSYVLATGGTETYDNADFTAALEAVTGLDYSFALTDQFGANANSTLNKAYIAHNNLNAKFTHFPFFGGYGTKAEFAQSIALAQGFNSDTVQLVHGAVELVSGITGLNMRNWGVMYNLCAILGRIAGKAPYIPGTNKTIGVDRLVHDLTEVEKTKALNAGVLVTVYNDYTNQFVILQAVNTLQDNASLFNAKAQSPSIQFMRIVAQINKELIVNASIDLLGQENGVNANTLSAGAVKDWTVAYLQSRVATDETDNLLLQFKDVNVTRKEDAYFVTYKIQVNNEITKLFFTGFLFR